MLDSRLLDLLSKLASAVRGNTAAFGGLQDRHHATGLGSEWLGAALGRGFCKGSGACPCWSWCFLGACFFVWAGGVKRHAAPCRPGTPAKRVGMLFNPCCISPGTKPEDLQPAPELPEPAITHTQTWTSKHSHASTSAHRQTHACGHGHTHPHSRTGTRTVTRTKTRLRHSYTRKCMRTRSHVQSNMLVCCMYGFLKHCNCFRLPLLMEWLAIRQVLLCGDFLQLPPVQDCKLLAHRAERSPNGPESFWQG